jgi:hypothetical protein
VQLAEAGIHRPQVLLLGEPERSRPGVEQLPRQQLPVGKFTIGLKYVTPCSAKTSPSLVNAAFTVSGVTVTVGHAFEPCRCVSGVCSTSTIGKKT